MKVTDNQVANMKCNMRCVFSVRFNESESSEICFLSKEFQVMYTI